MILNQRVIHETTDISNLVNDFRTGAYVFPYVAGEYLYIGSILPFNHLYFEIGVANDVAAVPSVDLWWNNAWEPAVDILDETSGLFQSGKLQFSTELDKSWTWERRASDITGLSTWEIYNMFWLRLSWDASLKATMTLKYIGQKFSDDQILFSYYPDLNNSDVMLAFAAGKTNWTEQHYMAAEHISKDMIKRNVITSRSQILDPYLFRDAACHKVAELVYTGLGRPYFELRQASAELYAKEMNVKFYNVDQNADARLDPIERKITTTFMTR